MTSAPSGSRRSPYRKGVGITLIVLGSLWLLVVGTLWLVIGALAGGEGILVGALTWQLFGATAAGLVVFVVGIGLQSDADERGLRKGLASVVLVLAVVTGVEWALTVPSSGPYPFGDAPRGSLIAYSAFEGIRLVRSDGGSSWLIPGTGGMSEPVWSRDGSTLTAVEGVSASFTFAPDGSERTRLPFDVETTPVSSPDGSRIAVVAAERPVIRVVRAADGSVEEVLPLAGNQPEWSPDGALIVFQSNRRTAALELYVVRPDGSGLRRLTFNGDDEDRVGCTSAAWAPDGRTIAFANDPGDDNDHVYTIRPDGTGLRRITLDSFDDASPTWSPDGRLIAFERTDYARDRTAIVVIDPATRTETEIVHVHGDMIGEPAWQPAGASAPRSVAVE